jgi:transcriptional regulator with XRE-family HTH domain
VTKTPNPIDQHIGRRIRMRRMQLSTSQEKLGDALGLTFQQVQKYEKGTNRVGGSRMVQIAAALETTPAFFFEGAPGKTAAGGRHAQVALETQFMSLPGAADLAAHFVAISDPIARRRIVEMAETMTRIPQAAMKLRKAS